MLQLGAVGWEAVLQTRTRGSYQRWSTVLVCMLRLECIANSDIFYRQNKHLPFDRVLGAGREAILYADITSETFGEYHKALSKAAAEGSLSYRIRYHRTQTTPRATLHMSGYGVELALKKTDYIVIDDRLQDEESHHQNIGAGTGLDDSEDVADIKPLTASDLSSLGLKATSFILQSDDPLETLVKLTQDLPKFLTSIVAHNVSTRFEKEFKLNSPKGVPGGLNLLWLNGVQLIERQIEPFALIERLRQERKLIDGFRALGLNGKQAASILGHQDVSTAKEGGEALRYDWTDRLEDGRVIIWLNDIESDDVYEDYPKSLTSVSRNKMGENPAQEASVLTSPATATVISWTTAAHWEEYLYSHCTCRFLKPRRCFIHHAIDFIHFSGYLYKIWPCSSSFNS